jgi:hypothetical protein
MRSSIPIGNLNCIEVEILALIDLVNVAFCIGVRPADTRIEMRTGRSAGVELSFSRSDKAIPGTDQKCEVCNLRVSNPQAPPFIRALVPPSAAPPPPALPEPSSPPAPPSPIELRLQPC